MAGSYLWVFVMAAVAAQGAAAKPDGAEKAADPMDKVICKRFLETGSLVKGYRTCKTKREWEQDRDAARTSSSSQAGACNRAGDGGIC